jgi:hypothetical protein
VRLKSADVFAAFEAIFPKKSNRELLAQASLFERRGRRELVKRNSRPRARSRVWAMVRLKAASRSCE